MMYQQNQQQANPQQQPQQYGNMNRMPMTGPGAQNMGPTGQMGMPNQGMQGMRQMGSPQMGMRPQTMPPQQQQQMIIQQQQQQMTMQQQQPQTQPSMVQQSQPQQQQQQQPAPSPQQQGPLSNQSQQPLTPMGYGEQGAATPSSPSVAPQTPNSDQQQQQQPATPTPQQPPQQKEINTAMVCRIGQETVQEIISRTHEVFSYLRVLQPPYGSSAADKNFYEKQQRLQEVLGGISTHFKRLRVCWEKANEHTAGMEYTQFESLIPLKDDQTMRNEIEKKRGESYKMALDEHNELIQQLVVKNKHVKEIIDQMRNIIWEINTMLAMR